MDQVSKLGSAWERYPEEGVEKLKARQDDTEVPDF